MNVTFHTLASFATAAVLSASGRGQTTHRETTGDGLITLSLGFGTALLLHGLLDYAPHSYPLPSGLDVALSLILLVVAIRYAKRQHRILLGVCFLGGVFPDLVDLAPALVNRHLGWALPVAKFFPWHWRQYSGSTYDGSRALESLLLHSLVIFTAFGLLWGFRRSLFILET